MKIDREWLLTNGLGGYAMGTLAGINTRRYHGLLVAAASPPVGRVVALHSVVEEIVIGGRRIDLSSQHFGDEPITHPGGASRIEDVAVTLPDQIRWRLRVTNEVMLTRTLRLTSGRNRAVITYEIEGDVPEGSAIVLRPLVALRDFHSLNRSGDPPLAASRTHTTTVRVNRSDSPALALDLTASSGLFHDEPDWWRNFAYALDRERGQDWHEDIFAPGRFEIALSLENRRAEVHAELSLPPQVEIRSQFPAERGDAVSTSPRARLEAAAKQFIVHRRVDESDLATIIAGYPWFADWGRDTMICIPGLCLSTGRTEEGERVLLAFARHIRNGLIPNRFDDYGASGGTTGAHYNTVDASLWFIHAVSETLACHPRADSRDELVSACRAIIRAYSEGTDFNIRMDPADSLIAAGDEQTQLTWMDAQRDGVTFTPRHGKAIEINALWHHALHRMAEMTDRNDEARHFRGLAKRAARSIQRSFWCESTGCCYDVLTEANGRWVGDESIRPNQVFAVSLAPSPLGYAKQKSILNVVREKLLTPYGLRTLDPAHPCFEGRFEGSLFDRDRAYHQGTVWPWLIGPYCEAVLRVGRFGAKAKREVERTIAPLLAELDAGSPGTCVGQIAEVYDGDPPHRPAGCPAQAWSVAELLRVLDMLE